jgi:hypothetical protein
MPEIAKNAVETVLSGAEIKEITSSPVIQGRYIKRQQPTASAVNHYDTIDITAGTNRKLVAKTTKATSISIISMSFSGNPLTIIPTVTSSVGDYKIESWWYDIPDAVEAGTYPVTMSLSDSRQAYVAYWYQLTNAKSGAPAKTALITNSVGTQGIRGPNITGSLNSFGIGLALTNRTGSNYIFSGIPENSVQGSTNYPQTDALIHGPIWSNYVTKVQSLYGTTAPYQMTNFVLFDAVQENYSVIFGSSGQNLFSMAPNSTQGSLVYITRNL